MPTDIQIVDPAEASRKLFGLRGKFSLALDETIAPVVIAAEDLTKSPWREQGHAWVIFRATSAVAAQAGRVDVIVPPGIQAVVDRLTVNATVATQYLYGSAFGIDIPTDNAVTWEHTDASAQPTLAPIRYIAQAKVPVGFAFTHGGISNAAAQVSLRDFPDPILIRSVPSGAGNLGGFSIESQTLNQACTFGIYGRWWPLR